MRVNCVVEGEVKGGMEEKRERERKRDQQGFFKSVGFAATFGPQFRKTMSGN